MSIGKGACGICGAHAEIHRWDDQACPTGGVEETRPDHKQEWAFTVFTPALSWSNIKEENEKLNKLVEGHFLEIVDLKRENEKLSIAIQNWSILGLKNTVKFAGIIAENKRLREALRQISELNDNEHYNSSDAKHIASAALNPTEDERPRA